MKGIKTLLAVVLVLVLCGSAMATAAPTAEFSFYGTLNSVSGFTGISTGNYYGLIVANLGTDNLDGSPDVAGGVTSYYLFNAPSIYLSKTAFTASNLSGATLINGQLFGNSPLFDQTTLKVGSSNSLTGFESLGGSRSGYSNYVNLILAGAQGGTIGITTTKTSGGITTTKSLAGTAATPIPAAAWLLGSGLVGLLGFRRRLS